MVVGELLRQGPSPRVSQDIDLGNLKLIQELGDDVSKARHSHGPWQWRRLP
jgi:hypothetical protein